jgi:UDP-N-acetylglucosamine 1-carboxyvinyltransferase
MLNAMGASVMGAGTGRIVVEGVERLEAVEWTVMPDRIEAGTFLMAAAATGGDVLVRNAAPAHLKMELDKLRGMGVEIETFADSPGVRARVGDPAALGRGRRLDAALPRLRHGPAGADDRAPHPGLGASIVTENVYENRLQVAEELNRMDAGIDLFGGHRALVRGPRRLAGTIVQAPDLRGGAALVMAGLAAEGTTVVEGAKHILRGYELFEEKLTNLGATIAFEAGAPVAG